jgi:PKD repeat protein
MTQSIDDAFMALGKDLKPLGMGDQSNRRHHCRPRPPSIYPASPTFTSERWRFPTTSSKDKPTSGYWQTANGGAVTRYNPLPVATAPLQIPVLMTVPNAKAGQQSKPATGWPVVIFQHGITQNRTNLFLLADALSFAGFRRGCD